MTKLTNPLLSLRASGTLSKSLSFDNRQGQPRVRTKPTPTYRNTLQQRYQRWDYQDAIFYWKSLSDPQRAFYKSYASKHHLTPLAACIRYYLVNLPDVCCRYRLEDPSGATCHDTSKNGNNGTYTGTTPTELAINGARYFDGIDDKVEIPHNDTLAPTDITIEAFVKCKKADLTWAGAVVAKFQAGQEADYMFDVVNTGFIRFNFYNGAWRAGWADNVQVGDDVLHYVAVTFKKPDIQYFVDGVPTSAFVSDHAMLNSGNQLWLGYYIQAQLRMKGTLDHLAIYNRTLSNAQILNHSDRRYPS